VDGVVIVIGGRGTPRDTVRHACARLRHAQANILGTMINRVNINDNDCSEDYYGLFAHAEGEPT
jgi:Mrp family chromosome partitioning ATPase